MAFLQRISSVSVRSDRNFTLMSVATDALVQVAASQSIGDAKE